MGQTDHEEAQAAIVADWATAKTQRDVALGLAQSIEDPEERAAAVAAARDAWAEQKAAIRARQDELDAAVAAEAGEG